MKNKIVHIVLILLIIIFVTSLVPKTFQNDTFFTIALGERTVKYGIEEADHLVWHENLKFIHLRWAFDVVIYKIYNLFNYQGIYIFTIILAVVQGLLYYAILNNLTKNKFLSFIATLITMYFCKNEFAARGQIVSFALFLAEFYCINKLLETNKNRYFICLLIIPLLLVNFHASVFPVYFVLYLPYLAEFILSKLKLKNKDSKIILENIKIKKLIILMVLGFLIGFISPIGLDAYKYMFKVMGGISKQIIAELKPVNLINSIYLTILIMLSICIISFTKVKVKLSDCLFILGFAFMSFTAIRCLYFFYLISSICVIRIFYDFVKEYKFDLSFINNKLKYLSFALMSVLLLVISLKSLFIELKEDYVESIDYPISATNYILSNIDISNMRIYNHFNFGSYLELNKIPVFIDSRSELYTEEFNPGTTILSDWNNVISGIQNYREIFNKYQITHALLYNDELIKQYIDYDDNWKIIYQDDRFSLYEKIK